MWPNNRQYSHRASNGYLFMTICEPFTNIAFSPYGRRTSFRVKQLGGSFRFVIVHARVLNPEASKSVATQLRQRLRTP